MPRPKGSKNRKSTEFVDTVENIDEKIAATESAIATLTATPPSAATMFSTRSVLSVSLLRITA